MPWAMAVAPSLLLVPIFQHHSTNHRTNQSQSTVPWNQLCKSHLTAPLLRWVLGRKVQPTPLQPSGVPSTPPFPSQCPGSHHQCLQLRFQALTRSSSQPKIWTLKRLHATVHSVNNCKRRLPQHSPTEPRHHQLTASSSGLLAIKTASARSLLRLLFHLDTVLPPPSTRCIGMGGNHCPNNNLNSTLVRRKKEQRRRDIMNSHQVSFVGRLEVLISITCQVITRSFFLLNRWSSNSAHLAPLVVDGTVYHAIFLLGCSNSTSHITEVQDHIGSNHTQHSYQCI